MTDQERLLNLEEQVNRLIGVVEKLERFICKLAEAAARAEEEGDEGEEWKNT